MTNTELIEWVDAIANPPTVLDRLVCGVAYPSAMDAFLDALFEEEAQLERDFVQWVSGAPLAWVSDLVALLGNPPPNSPPQREKNWDYGVEQILGWWARHDPENVFPLLTPLLGSANLRLNILGAIEGAATRSAAEHLEPFLPEAVGWTEEEQEILVDILFNQRPMLVYLREHISPQHQEVHQKVEYKLTNLSSPEGCP